MLKSPRICLFPEHRRSWPRLPLKEGQCHCCAYRQAEGVFDLSLKRMEPYPASLEQAVNFWLKVNFDDAINADDPFEPCWLHEQEWSHWQGKPIPSTSLAFMLVWGEPDVNIDLVHYGPGRSALRCCNPFHLHARPLEPTAMEQMRPSSVLQVQTAELLALDQLDELLEILGLGARILDSDDQLS